MHVIDDFNFADEISHQLSEGRKPGIKPRRKPMGKVDHTKVFADAMPIIPESEWEDRIKEMDQLGAWVNDKRRKLSAELGKPVIKFQNGLNLCHLYSAANCIEAVGQNMDIGYLNLSPESGGGVNRWANDGGTMDEDIEWLAEHGLATREYVPDHCLDTRKFKSGWEDNAQEHIPTEWFELGHENMWREMVTACLCGFPIYMGVAWWMHAIMGGKLVVVNREICLEIENSHGIQYGDNGYGVLKGSRKIATAQYGCYALRTCTFARAARMTITTIAIAS